MEKKDRKRKHFLKKKKQPNLCSLKQVRIVDENLTLENNSIKNFLLPEITDRYLNDNEKGILMKKGTPMNLQDKTRGPLKLERNRTQ